MTNQVQEHNRPSKGYIGLPMEGMIATWYAKNTKTDEDRESLARRLAETIPTGSSLLEVAPGPGYLAIRLAKTGRFQVSGLDISKTFVEIEQKNARNAGVSVDFRLGNASSMPFQSETFDFIVCRAAFKNFSEPVRALQEMQRVLRPGGKALIVDLRRDADRNTIDRAVDGMGMNSFNAWFTRITFRQMLLKRAYTRAEVLEMAKQTAFSKCEVIESGIGMEIWLEK